jgi:hypothetical protein
MQPYYVPYQVFRYDTTLAVDTAGIAIVLRYQVTGQRLVESTVKVPRATYANCKAFLLTFQLGFVGEIPGLGQQFVPLVTMQDSVWMAQFDWIVKMVRPPVRIDLSSLAIPGLSKIDLPGHESVLESATILTGIAETSDHTAPTKFLLLDAYPNPFNPATVLRFDLPSGGEVALKVFDVMGREVANLLNGFMSQGPHEVRWNPGQRSSGIYVARIQHQGRTMSRTLMLMK